MHLLRHLYIDFEELGDAAVEANRLALVKVCFAIGGWNTFLCAGLDEATKDSSVHVYIEQGGTTEWQARYIPVIHVRDHFNLGLDSCNLFGRRRLGTTTTEEERHV